MATDFGPQQILGFNHAALPTHFVGTNKKGSQAQPLREALPPCGPRPGAMRLKGNQPRFSGGGLAPLAQEGRARSLTPAVVRRWHFGYRYGRLTFRFQSQPNDAVARRGRAGIIVGRPLVSCSLSIPMRSCPFPLEIRSEVHPNPEIKPLRGRVWFLNVVWQENQISGG